MREYVVYILRCADKSLYVGVTNNLSRRLEEHAEGINDGAYTHDRRPVEMAHAIYFLDIRDAIDCEKMIKAWSRKKKEALVRGERMELKLLSRKKFPGKFKMQCIRTIAYQRFFLKMRLRSLLGHSGLVPRTNSSRVLPGEPYNL